MAEAAELHRPVQARSQRTRAALVAAARAEFSARGYASTTAKSIANRAKTGVGTFYRYFPDKDAVLREITRERVEWVRAQAEPLGMLPRDIADGAELLAAARDRIRRLVEINVAHHRADRGIHTVISERRLCDPSVDAIMTESERYAVQQFAAALTEWGFDGDAEAAAFMWFSLLDGATHAHVLSEPVLSDARFVESLVDSLLRIGLPSRFLGASFHGAR